MFETHSRHARLFMCIRLLVAVRILRSATELGWATVAVYTDNDTSHATFADEAVKLSSVADFLSVETIVEVAKR